MKSIINELLYACNGEKLSPGGRAARQAGEPVFLAIREKLSLEEFDQFWAAAMDVGCADIEASFAAGFRLGAKLMLEVLGE